jgi:uncharacterized secreted protein with C-terminal beta-propeller domain
MQIAAMAVTIIDDQHIMVKVRWEESYLQTDGSEVKVDVDKAYIVQTLNGRYKIIAAVDGEGAGLLRKHGLTR